MKQRLFATTFFVLIAAAGANAAEIQSVKKIWDDAPHNAFTDLVRFKDRWYCVFREGKAHVSPDGALRVLTSKDGDNWESAALIESETADLRDAKITITPKGQLMLSGAGALNPPADYKHQSMTWFSDDGKSWSQANPVGQHDFWLWRTTWHKEKAYGIGYATNKGRSVRLYHGTDGKKFDVLVENLFDEGYPNETSLLFLKDDTCYCLLRRDGKPNTALLGTSQPPYTKWSWKDLGKRIGGPHMIRLPDGRIVAVVRLYDGGARTSLCWLDPEKGSLTEFLKLPSGGDTSYAGLVWHEEMLWISYYSSHEGKTSIYLAQVGSLLETQTGIIASVAGTGEPSNNGDEGKGVEVNVGDPFGVEVGPDGGLYITEVRNHRVRRLDLTSGMLTTVAGSGRKGYSGDGGPAAKADLNEPYEVRFDGDGNMFFVEMKNHLIRRVDAKTKVITTIAGTGSAGFSGDGGPAIKAQFRNPHSIALDGKGGLYVADIGNHRIRRIDLKTGIVETIAGSAERKLPQDGQQAQGNPILGPRALFIDGKTMWIALREGHSVWRMNLDDGILRHVAGTGRKGFSGDGGPAKDATFNGPKGIATGPNGNVYVVDTENHAIRKIDVRSKTITTIAGSGPAHGGGAGDGGPATQAELKRPHGICVGADGAVYIGDTLNHRVRRVQ